MPTPYRYLFQQGPVLGGLAKIIYRSLTGPRDKPFEVPGPELEAVVPPRQRSMIMAYVRHVGGEPGQYKTVLPFHLYPQWGFPLLARAVEHVPYDLIKMLNAASEVTIHEPLPNDLPLMLKARLQEAEINERRAKLTLHLTTGTKKTPRAMEVHQTGIIPLVKPQKGNSAPPRKRFKPRVPEDVREVGRFRVGPRSGLDFAMLTGDINPLHWLPPYAKAMGHPRPILHGFSLLARTVEILNRKLYSGDIHKIKQLAVRFRRPLRLPADVGVFVQAEGGLYAGTAPSGPAYLTGSFNTKPQSAD
jgi:acyl dehydratase